jgi:hypothetical protein
LLDKVDQVSRTRSGSGRAVLDRQDYARFLNIAEGSLAETEYLLILARDLGYLKPEDAEPRFADLDEVARMLNGLRRKSSRRVDTAPKLSTLNCRLSTARLRLLDPRYTSSV